MRTIIASWKRAAAAVCGWRRTMRGARHQRNPGEKKQDEEQTENDEQTDGRTQRAADGGRDKDVHEQQLDEEGDCA
jgi:hypothetical protein